MADELAAHSAGGAGPRAALWRSLKAEALDRLGRREEAIELAQAELEVTRAFGAPSALGRTLRVLGTLERDDGLDRLREAVAVVEGSTARLEHAKALAALGASLRRARQPSEAREPLRRALELAGVCGADGLAAQVRAELHAAGARPRRDALSGVDSLTPSERRVADLAVAGTQQPRDRPGALRDAEDGRGPPLERLSQARHPLAARARARRLGTRRSPRGARRNRRVAVSGSPRCGMAGADRCSLAHRSKGPDPWPSPITRPHLGRVVRPGDHDWDAARSTFNVLIDQQPEAIAFPASEREVAAVVADARERGLRVAVQATGHNPGPLGSLEGTLILNTSALTGVSIDADARACGPARRRAGRRSRRSCPSSGWRRSTAPRRTWASSATRSAAASAGSPASTACRPTP